MTEQEKLPRELPVIDLLPEDASTPPARVKWEFMEEAVKYQCTSDQILYDALWKEKDRLEKETLSANSQLLSDIKLIETLTEKNERIREKIDRLEAVEKELASRWATEEKK